MFPSRSVFSSLSRDEIRSIRNVSALDFLRYMALFLTFPVVVLYARQFTSSDLLVSLAYAAQPILLLVSQYPMGVVSDRMGRRPSVAIALVPFALGNILSFHPFSIYGLIAFRALSGVGSVSVSTNALLQESVRPEFRSRATAIAGIAVGAALLLGIALGPVLASVIGLSYVFLVSGVLALLSLALVPGLSEVRGERLHGPARPSPLYIPSIASGILVSAFFYFTQSLGIGLNSYYLYLLIPAVIGGAIAVGLSGLADIKGRRPFALTASAVLLISLPVHIILPSRPFIYVSNTLFLLGYSLFEALFVPMLLASVRGEYGSVIGLSNTFMYIGQALGSLAGPILGVGNTVVLASASSLAMLATFPFFRDQRREAR
ncbi:tetracycline resistance MFS efflux pump [Thermogymnomonas acidicola]|uniref:Tetracycline resistance MFS efflux pump n=1 Tax=Thermogymnomonas acidicola TaxID=399579 RepID=A0AA37BRR7_9ARCH|nr:MFS transporter [Thermogymnomonas acidicola]GGM75501.1 tetracycline resistance MFS efflux pump [Thermogymnomonas acidicola]